ncbi:MAG: glycosyltransferase [Alphaproteobacteria bacterium]|nr:glycosyltransferase [Alphaproteobacteria bacterium]
MTFSAHPPCASILIVAYQSGAHLERCVAALDAQTWRDFEVIVWDNTSTDGAVDRLRPRPWLRIERSDENLGFAVGNNRAAALARGRYLITLNPDATADPGWLAALIAAAERHPEAGSIASVQLDASTPELLDGLGDPYTVFGAAWRGGKGRLAVPMPEGEVFGACAAAALYRRDAFEAVGGFCARFFCYYEDVDLALRLRLAGWRAIVTPGAVVRHVGSASAPSDFVVRHVTRNRLWTMVRGLPGPLLVLGLPPALGLATLGALMGVFRGQCRRRFMAIGEAFIAFADTWAERRDIQANRRVSVDAIASALTWSPLAYLRRAIDIRPLRDLVTRVAEPPAEDNRVAAVVVSHQPDTTLDQVLDAALAQCALVVLVDNASEGDAQSRLRARAEASDGHLVFIANPDNRGLAAAQNQGIAVALATGADWVLLLDDDSVPDPGMVSTLLASWRGLADRRRVGLLAPRLTDAEGTLKPYLLTARGRFGLARGPLGPGEVVRDGVFAIASGSLIRARVLEVVGAMADGFFIDYIDVEFCLRLRSAGFEVVGVGDAGLRHRLGDYHESQLLGRRVALNTHSAWRRFFIHRNRVRVWRRYGSANLGWLAFDVTATVYDVVKAGVLEDDKAAKLSAILRGFTAGWRG